MYTTLLHQYQLVLSARGAFLNYCETITPQHLAQPLPAFNNESIASNIMHVVSCYQFWLGETALKEQRPIFNAEGQHDLQALRAAYGQIDLIMNDFLHHFTNSLAQPMLFTRPDGNEITRSPLEIFTHVISHEFHHKGQALSMSRHVGYTPVDTDVIRD